MNFIDEVLERYATDFEAFARDLLAIEPEEGGRTIPLDLNGPQRWFRWTFRDHVRRGIALKGRGEGITTVGLGEAMWRTWGQAHHHGAFIAHTDEETRKGFRAAQLMEAAFPEECRHHQPTSNLQEIHYDRMTSWLRIATAGARAPVRGGRLHYAWLTEAAFYPGDMHAQGTLMEGVLGTARRGIVRVESTGNGRGNWFYETFAAAQQWAAQHGFVGLFNGRGPTRDEVRRLRLERLMSQWVPLFMPWWWDERNRIEMTEEERQDFRLTEAEAAWAVPAQVPIEAAAWYREKQKEYLPRSLIKQAYPCTWLEAFLVVSDSFFDPDVVTRRAAMCPDPIRRMHGGATWVWEEPVAGEQYVIGADSAEGTPGGNYSVATVRRRRTSAQVARFRAKCKPKEFARIIAELGRLYNLALAAPERNREETVNRLVEIYPHIYHAVDPLKPDQLDPRPGIYTQDKNRSRMLDQLRQAVEGDGHEGPTSLIRDPMFWAECARFRRNRSGKYEAESGAYDDCIFAECMAEEALQAPQSGVHF